MENGQIHYSLGLDLTQLRTDANKATQAFKNIGDSAVSEGDRIDGAFKKIGAAAAGIFTFSAAKGFVQKMYEVRATFQDTESSMTVFLGSAEKAAKFMKQLQDYAWYNMFEFSDLTKESSKLLAFGNDVSSIIPILDKLSNVASGTKQPLGDLVDLYNKAKNIGKVDAQGLESWATRGVVVTDVLKQMGVEVDRSSVKFEHLEMVLNQVTSEGGMFYNLMGEQMDNLSSSMGQLEDNLTNMFNELGERTEDVMKGSIEMTAYLVDNYQEVGKSIAELVAAYGTYRAALLVVTVLENYKKTSIVTTTAYNAVLMKEATITSQLTFAKWAQVKAQTALNATMRVNPYVIAAAAIAGLAYGVYKLSTYQTDAEKSQSRLDDSHKEFSKSVDSEERKLAILVGKLDATTKGSKEYNTIKNEIISNYGQYDKNLQNEIDKVGLTEAAYKRLTTAIRDSFSARQYTKFMEGEEAQFDDVMSDNLEKIQKSIHKNIDDNKVASTLYEKIRKAIVSGTDIQYKGESWEIIGGLEQAAIDQLNSLGDKWVQYYIYQVDKAKKEKDKIDADAKERFGITDTIVPEVGEVEDSVKSFVNISEEVDKTKTKITELKQEIADLRSGKTQLEIGVSLPEEIDKKVKELGDAEKELATLTGVDKKSEKKSSEEASQLKIAAANRLRAEQDYAEKLKIQAKNTELEMTQSRIDAMDEGLNKELAQIDLIYERLFFENEQRQAQMLEDLRNIEEVKWNQENPKAKEKGQTFDRSTITEESLSGDQLAQIKAFEDAANKYRIDANKNALEDIISDVQTYEQQRTKIAEDFEKKRKSLYTEEGNLREGVTQGNIEELDYAENEALLAVDEEFAQREKTFESWMNAIAEMSLRQLEDTLTKAEAELAKLKQSGATGSSVALARQKVTTAKEKIAKTNADNSVSPGKKELKEWQELQDAIYSADSALGDIEDSLEGTAKDIVKTARQIGDATTRIIDGIVLLANSAISGAQTTAVGAAAAIATVEKASVILAIISAALMIVTQMFALFSKKDVMAEFNNELADLNKELAKAKLNARIGNDDRESIFGEDSWRSAIDNINAATDALTKYNDTLESIRTRKKNAGLSDEMAERLNIDNYFDDLDESLKNMQIQVRHKTWFRSAKYKSLSEVSELFNDDGSVDMESLREFTESDMFEKLSEENQAYLLDMLDYWEAYENAVAEVKDYLSDIFGDLGATMTDALVDAFANGTDAAQAFSDSVSDMLEKLAKQMIYAATLAPLAKKAEEEIFNIMQTTGLSDEERFKRMTGVIDEFVEDAIDGQEVANDLFKRYQETAAKYGYDIFSPDEEERKSAAKGLASMSQDSADELNGRFTSIQSMTFEINNNVKMLTENSSQSLRHLAGIEQNTGRLEAIENNVISMNRKLEDIQLKGLKIV